MRLKKFQYFYVFSEHSDFVTECKHFDIIQADNEEYFPRNFKCGDIKYEALYIHDCYSGGTVTVMRHPELNFQGLISLLKTTKSEDEILGSIGILLKKHYNDFYYLLKNREFFDKKRLKTISKFILNYIAIECIEVSEMNELLSVCKEILNKRQ